VVHHLGGGARLNFARLTDPETMPVSTVSHPGYWPDRTRVCEQLRRELADVFIWYSERKFGQVNLSGFCEPDLLKIKLRLLHGKF